MKRISFLFILSILSISWLNSSAQETEVKKKNGLTTVTFNTPKGKVTVTLPEKTHAGDVISGTVIAEPKGKSEKQKTKNKNILNGYVVELEKKKNPVNKEKVSWEIPDSVKRKETNMVLKNEKGDILCKTLIPIIETSRSYSTSGAISATDFKIPGYFRAGEPEMIPGVFDGNFQDSRIILDGKEVEILAESPSEIVFVTPEDISGKVLGSVFDNNVKTDFEIHVIRLNIRVESLSLRRGEKSTLSIEVSGLKNIGCEIPISISNLSPENIELDGGDYQMMFIKPAIIRDKESFRLTTGISAIRSGSFSISAEILPFNRAAYFSSQAVGN